MPRDDVHIAWAVLLTVAIVGIGVLGIVVPI